MTTTIINNSTTFTSKKLSTSTKMETPTSYDQLVHGEELIHFSHPQHQLVQLSFPYIFTCMGCKEYGAGKRFKCKHCDFDLHDFCALAPPSIQRHPFHSQHQLVFYTKPAGGLLRSRCDVCGKAARGYAYRCSTCNFEMHPCCAKLSQKMDFSVHPHSLSLLPVTTSTNGDSGCICGECNKKRLGRVYVCKVCDYHLHAVCAKALVNGLHANGIKAPEKASMLGTAARIVSHIFLGFIGGLIEGIGDGVGEVLMENIAKGNGSNRRRTPSNENVYYY